MIVERRIGTHLNRIPHDKAVSRRDRLTTTTLGEVVEFHDHRRVPLSSLERARRQGPFPYYGASGIIDSIDDYLFDGEYLLIAEDGENLRSRKLPVCFLASGQFWVNNHAHVVKARSDRAENRFLASLLAHVDISGYITGTAQPKLSQANLKAIRIALPDVETQRKIAATLSAYDDLIELNLRRITILEEMARRIYREWFVRFRFPGHEGVRMVDSAVGKVPEGWKVVTIRDVSGYINRGVSPKYDDQALSIVINQKCIRDCRLNLELARRHSTSVPPEKLVRVGDVLVNSTGIGTLGRVAQVWEGVSQCTVDSHVTIVRPGDTVLPEYLGAYLETLEAHFDSLGTGSTGQTELGRELIGGTEFLLPPYRIQEKFAALVRPARQAVALMFRQNSNLCRTRDLLLPKLVSGEVDASHLLDAP